MALPRCPNPLLSAPVQNGRATKLRLNHQITTRRQCLCPIIKTNNILRCRAAMGHNNCWQFFNFPPKRFPRTQVLAIPYVGQAKRFNTPLRTPVITLTESYCHSEECTKFKIFCVMTTQ